MMRIITSSYAEVISEYETRFMIQYIDRVIDVFDFKQDAVACCTEYIISFTLGALLAKIPSVYQISQVFTSVEIKYNDAIFIH